MKKYRIEVIYKIPFLYQDIEANNKEEAEIIALDRAKEEYENETTFDIDEEVNIKEL